MDSVVGQQDKRSRLGRTEKVGWYYGVDVVVINVQIRELRILVEGWKFSSQSRAGFRSPINGKLGQARKRRDIGRNCPR